MLNTNSLLKSAAGITLGLVLMHATAKADYDLTLTPLLGSEGGTGTLSVIGPVPSSGLFLFGTSGSGAHQLTALDITIDSETFDLSDAVPGSNGAFFNGSLAGLFYSGSIGNLQLSIFDGLDGTVVYQLTGGQDRFDSVYGDLGDNYGDIDGERLDAFGMIMAGTTSVPEPASVALLGTLLLMLWFPLRKMLSRAA